MWNWLSNSLGYFTNVIMPTRFRRAAVEHKATDWLDASARSYEQPEELVDFATHEASQTTEEELGRKVDEGSTALEEGEVEAAEKKSSFWSIVGAIVRWVLHFLLLALILVGLWFLNWWLGVDTILQSNWPLLHPFWLPLLFLLLYSLMWLGIWLWLLSSPERVSWDYPDITAAWETARVVLHRNGIDLRETPVFLVLGQNEGALDHLLGTASLRLRVTAPRGGGSAIRFYANDDRIFVTCPGASVMARQARFLMQQGKRRREQIAQVQPENILPETENPKTAGEEEAGKDQIADADPLVNIPGVTDVKSNEGSAAEAAEHVTNDKGKLTEELWSEDDERAIGLLLAEEQPRSVKQPLRSFLRNAPEMRLLTSRMHHFCRLLRNDRKPFCPINGILVLVPFAATEEETDASQSATACRYDLNVIRHVLQVQCPIYALVCDMEKSEGFRQFVQRLPGRERIPRLGQQFPLYPDVDEKEIPRAVETGTAWLSDALLPSLVYNLFRLESNDALERREVSSPDAMANNTRLYEFLHQMRERRKRLGRFLARGLMLDVPGSFYFGGVYLAGTGRGFTVFVRGVMEKLIDNQNYVSWTEETLNAERRYRRWSWVLFFVNLLLLIGGPLLAWWFWPL